MNALENTIVIIAKQIKEKEGKLATIDGHSNIHFCNGSPGAIPMLIAGSEIFPAHASDFLDTASIIGELIF